jgi:hypothetical protein
MPRQFSLDIAKLPSTTALSLKVFLRSNHMNRLLSGSKPMTEITWFVALPFCERGKNSKIINLEDAVDVAQMCPPRKK